MTATLMYEVAYAFYVMQNVLLCSCVGLLRD